MAGGREKRKMTRGNVLVPVTFKHQGNAYHSYAQNISIGGLFIVWDTPLAVGEQVEVRFKPPKSNIMIDAMTVVCWWRPLDPAKEDEPPGMGLKFVARMEDQKPSARSSITDLRGKETPAWARRPGTTLEKLDRQEPPKGPPDGLVSLGDKVLSAGENLPGNTSPRKLGVKLPSALADFKTPGETPPPLPASLNAAKTEAEPPRKDAPPTRPAVTAAKRHRQVPRVRVEVQIDMQTESNFYVGFSENISSGGLFIATYDPFPIGTELALNFRLPNRDKPFSPIGVVRWVRSFDPMADESIHPGMGAQFLQLTDEETAAINYFIRRIREPYFVPVEDA